MYGEPSENIETVMEVRKRVNASKIVDDSDSADFEQFFGFNTSSALSYFLLLNGELYFHYDVNTALEFAAYGSSVFRLNHKKYQDMYKAVSLEYNPIHNYDMTESGTDSTVGKNIVNASGTDKTDNNTSTQVTSNVTDNGTTTEGVTAYDRAEFKDSSKTTNVNTAEGGSLTKNSGNVTVSSTSDTTTDNNVTLTHSLTRTGNIGVTTSQQMLISELDLIPRKQLLYEFFNDYKNMLCLSIYK